MRLLVITDTWTPQINGVANTYSEMARRAPELGFELISVTPSMFWTAPCPTYPEIRLALATKSSLQRKIEAARADYIHIATEGPLGILARAVCNKHRHPYTTCYHTRFPEYAACRFPVPKHLIRQFQRAFHNSSAATLVRSPLLLSELSACGYGRLRQWMGGVDLELFHPRRGRSLSAKRPVFLYVGRLAIEKNIEEFLRLDLPGTKLVVGDGPLGPYLRRQYPHAVFLGYQTGATLARLYSFADVLVFPSRTDTFGMVVLEALACGLPVAAHAGPGPSYLIASNVNGVVDEDLGVACLGALDLRRADARASAERFPWQVCALAFGQAVRRAHTLAAARHTNCAASGHADWQLNSGTGRRTAPQTASYAETIDEGEATQKVSYP